MRKKYLEKIKYSKISKLKGENNNKYVYEKKWVDKIISQVKR